MEFEVSENEFLNVYQPLLWDRTKYLALWGGRGSGKSQFAAQKLLLRCLNDDFFRCILLRKIYASIEESQFKTLKDIAQDWGIADYFIWNTSPIKIICKLNGNYFQAKGLDKPDKTKSVKDPTAIWFEEASELTHEDFIASTTSVRTPKAKYIQHILTFNPECKGDYKEFWLYKQQQQENKNWKFVHTT